MSNLLKSKFLLGVMVVAVMFVGAVALSATPAAADCSITTTLRVGSTGVEVQCLQGIVGATADGKFGPMTKASVMAWQSGHGLSADGVVGPLTRAALMGAPSGNFPAGCSSASGFSSTTGLSCASVSANTFAPSGCTSASGFSPVTGGACYAASSGLPAGCSSTSGFSPTTGARCDSGSTLPAGCSSTSGFSPTTGLSCSGAPVVSASGEGSLTVTLESSPSNGTEIAYDTTASVMALKVKATGAAMEVNRVDFNFGARPWLYVNKAGLYDGSTLVAERSLSSSSFDEIAVGTSYRLRFDSLNIAVAKDATKILTLKLTAPSIISAVNTLVTITTAIDSVRASDGTGLVSYEGVAGTRTFKIKTATAGSLVASLDSTSPNGGIIGVDDVDNTNGVTLLVVGLKATGDAVRVTSIPVVATVTTIGSGFVSDVIDSLYLYKDGVQLASGTYATDCATALFCTVTFSDLNETIAKDSTAIYTIKANLKPIDGSIVTANDTVQVTMTVASIVAEDTNFSSLTGGELSGTSIGTALALLVNGVNVVMGATTYTTVTDSGNVTQVTYTIPLTVTAFGNTLYLGQVAQQESDYTSITAQNALTYSFENSATPTTQREDSAGATSTLASSDATLEAGTGFRLDSGTAKHFTLQVVEIAPSTAGAAGSYRVMLNGIQTYTNAALTAGELIQQLLPVQNFQTGYQYITS